MHTLVNTMPQEKYVSAGVAALNCKCPKCRKGDMYTSKLWSFQKQAMNETCSHCGFKFEIEPGYFYVAMFVSYAFNIAEMVTIAVATYILTGSHNPWLYCVLLLGGSVILSRFNFRYSRVVLLYWLTPGLHYDPNRARDDYQKKNL